jgi:hypothetical protein
MCHIVTADIIIASSLIFHNSAVIRGNLASDVEYSFVQIRKCTDYNGKSLKNPLEPVLKIEVIN